MEEEAGAPDKTAVETTGMVQKNSVPVVGVVPAKKSKKKIIIISIIVVVVIILYFVSRMIFTSYVVSTSKEMILNSTLSSVRMQHDEVSGESAETLEEAREIVRYNKEFQMERIDKIKNTGEDVATLQEFFTECEEDMNLSREDELKGFSCNRTGNRYSSDRMFNISLNKSSHWIVELSGAAVSISLQEEVLDLLENELDFDSSNEITAVTLGVILSVAERTIMWSSLIKAEDEVYRNNELEGFNPDVPPIEKDLRVEIPKIEIFSNDMPLPSEEQINNVRIVDACIKGMEEAGRESVLEGASRKSFWDVIFFTNKIKKICTNLEEYRKRQMLRLLKRTENEQNPFQKITQKLSLNLFVECGWNWGDGADCSENYFDNFEKSFISALR